MVSITSISAGTLSEADFQSHPIWQFLTDIEGNAGEDESHVAPGTEPLTIGTHGSYLVAATYRLKNGASLPGAVQVDVLDQKVYFTPAVVYAQGKAVDPQASDAETRLTRITKTPYTRPVCWELVVSFEGESKPRQGRISRSTLGAAISLLVRLILLKFTKQRP